MYPLCLEVDPKQALGSRLVKSFGAVWALTPVDTPSVPTKASTVKIVAMRCRSISGVCCRCIVLSSAICVDNDSWIRLLSAETTA